MSENDDSTPGPAPAANLPTTPAPAATAAADPAPGPPAAPPAGGRLGRLSPQAKIALGLGTAIALALLLWPRSKAERKFEDGSLIDESGATVALAGELAPATLVHFWATWCPPCRQEIPSLLAFAGEVGDRRLKLVLVAVADERDRAVEFVGNPRYPVLFDPVWDVARRFRTTQLPETHLILDGKIAASFIGAADWHDAPTAVARRTVLARLADGAEGAKRPGQDGAAEAPR